jgi:hypothetical protein
MNPLLADRNQSPFGTGLRLALANKRLLLWVYLATLAVGLSAALPFHARMASILDHSLAAQSIAGHLDLSSYGLLMMDLGRHGTSLYMRAFAAILGYCIVSNILAAGIYYVFATGDLPRLAVVVRAGIEYFWRFFRLLLFVLIVAGPCLAILGVLRRVILKHADNVIVGREYFFISLATFAVFALVALFFRLWFDLVEARVVQLGLDGERRVRRALIPCMRLLCQRFLPAYFGYFLIGCIGWIAFFLCVWVWMAAIPPHAVFLAWIVGQLATLSLLAARIWERGFATAMVAFAEPPGATIAAEPLQEPLQPVPSIPSEPVVDAPAATVILPAEPASNSL